MQTKNIVIILLLLAFVVINSCKKGESGSNIFGNECNEVLDDSDPTPYATGFSFGQRDFSYNNNTITHSGNYYTFSASHSVYEDVESFIISFPGPLPNFGQTFSYTISSSIT